MLTIRSVDPSELASWAALDDRQDRYLFRQISSLVERGGSRPEWCLLAERDGRPVGRVAVVAEPLASVDPSLEYRLLGLWLPWADGPVEVGAALVEAAIDRAIPPGAHPLDVRINPDYQPHAEIRRALADRTGFALFQEKEGYRWSADRPEPERRRPARLTFRSVEDVGEEALAEVMGRCTAGSLDRVDRQYAAIVGRDAWGREMLGYLTVEDRPSWRLALTAAGDPAGYILLGGFDLPGRATIVHIGIVPEQRGNGYVDELLAEFDRMARERGFTSAISDVDVQNGPMDAAMERNGHRSADTSWHVWHYRRIVGGRGGDRPLDP